MRRLVLAALLASAALPALRADAEGVTLFRDRRMRGPSVTFEEDVPDLGLTRFGRNRASSIAVSRGCEAVLYARPGYRGRASTFREDDENLANAEVGEDTASSLRVRCRGDRGDDDDDGDREQGVRLFRDRELEGPSQLFTEDEPDLSRTRFGSDRASSLDVSPGCVVTLYERRGYRGRRTEFRERDENLANTEVGEDRASSLRIRCRDDRGDDDDRDHHPPEEDEHPDEPEGGRGVRLFRDSDLEGASQLFVTDVPDLSRTRFGNDQASSLDLSPGCVAILFEHAGYEGRRAEFRERDNNLRNTPVGGDTASSLKVRCN